LTDFADFPPHFWIEPQDQFFVCGTERAAAQAVELGVPPGRVLRSSGMIVHPRFYEAPPINREAERLRLGLDPAIPTGLVIFGGQGSTVMREIARRVEDSSLRLQLIFICGHNQALADDLRQKRSRHGRVVIGFTDEVPFFLQLADFFIGKPGPGSLSEALVMKLPVIVERNARTMPQERYNVEWLLENKAGLAVKDFREIAVVLGQFLDPHSLVAYRHRVAALENRAVFEIPCLLQQVRDRATSSGAAN
jgi:1,2-diacylglycerol 3-beta-galactosyltransferase